MCPLLFSLFMAFHWFLKDAYCKHVLRKPNAGTPSVECTHFNAFYKTTFVLWSNVIVALKKLFLSSVWEEYRSACVIAATWEACVALVCCCHLYKGMRKFQLMAIWWCNVRKSRLGSLSLPLCLCPDLLEALRWSDACMCLGLVTEGKWGSSDGWSHCLIHIHYLSRLLPHNASLEIDLRTLVYHNWLNCQLNTKTAFWSCSHIFSSDCFHMSHVFWDSMSLRTRKSKVIVAGKEWELHSLVSVAGQML